MRRNGVSILEVLFAILVTVIGLLGVIAIFPVAASMARKGRTKDAVAVSGPTAFHQFDTLGMRRSAGWMAWNNTAMPPAYQNFTPQFGESYCIDPRMLTANAGSENAASIFPYVPRAVATDPRMRRITINGGIGPMHRLHAEKVFVFEDDLNINKPDDRSLEAGQIFDELPGTPGAPSARQTQGHLSWMATLVPNGNRYSVPTATDPFEESYVLSIVVFFDRPADMTVNDPQHERVLTVVSMPGGGVTGGEVQLQASTVDALKIRPDDWLMLAGLAQHTIPNSDGSTRFIPRFQWYRVVDCEPEATQVGANYERYVTLHGQDWNASLTSTQAFVMDGVVGVYDKTVTLER